MESSLRIFRLDLSCVRRQSQRANARISRFLPPLMQHGNQISTRHNLHVSIVTNGEARGTIGFVMSYMGRKGEFFRQGVAYH